MLLLISFPTRIFRHEMLTVFLRLVGRKSSDVEINWYNVRCVDTSPLVAFKFKYCSMSESDEPLTAEIDTR